MTCLETHKSVSLIVQLLSVWRLLRFRVRLGRGRARDYSLMRLLLIYTCQLGLSVLAPRTHHVSATPLRLTHDFEEDEFKDHFRWRPAHFMQLLAAFDLVSAQDATSPIWMRVGRRGRQSWIRSDWGLMVLLKRLASASTYKDLRFVLGGNKTLLCDTFLFMLRRTYRQYATHTCSSLLKWEHYMLPFAKLLKDKGSPYENLIGLVDGTFLHMSAPVCACLNVTAPVCACLNIDTGRSFHADQPSRRLRMYQRQHERF
jgi:hypothetical protein